MIRRVLRLIGRRRLCLKVQIPGGSGRITRTVITGITSRRRGDGEGSGVAASVGLTAEAVGTSAEASLITDYVEKFLAEGGVLTPEERSRLVASGFDVPDEVSTAPPPGGQTATAGVGSQVGACSRSACGGRRPTGPGRTGPKHLRRLLQHRWAAALTEARKSRVLRRLWWADGVPYEEIETRLAQRGLIPPTAHIGTTGWRCAAWYGSNVPPFHSFHWWCNPAATATKGVDYEQARQTIRDQRSGSFRPTNAMLEMMRNGCRNNCRIMKGGTGIHPTTLRGRHGTKLSPRVRNP